MKVAIQIAPADDARAWGLLVRHSSGEAYPNRIVVVSAETVEMLRKAGIQFTELPRDAVTPGRQAGV